jgi:hypothetical protein
VRVDCRSASRNSPGQAAHIGNRCDQSGAGLAANSDYFSAGWRVVASAFVDYVFQGAVKFLQFVRPRPDGGQLIGAPVANLRTGTGVAINRFEEASTVIVRPVMRPA